MDLKKITYPVVIPAIILVLAMTYFGKLPSDMMGSFAIMFALGIIFGEIGDRVPFISNWLGGGPIVCIFGPALLVYFGILPASLKETMSAFMNETNFFAFFIATMIAGAIFQISQKIIVKATIKFLPTILGGLLVSFLFAGIGGLITGYGFYDAVLYLAIPIMGGGIGAGALPLSQIYANAANVSGSAGSAVVDAASVLSSVMPAVVLGNVFSIIAAGLLDKLGKKYPKLTGNGQLLKVADNELLNSMSEEKIRRDKSEITVKGLGAGFFVTIMLYMVALAINKLLFPQLHTFVYLILLLTIIKAAKLFPESLEVYTIQWSNVWVKNLLYAALIPVGFGFIDIPAVMAAVTNPAFMIISLLVVLGSIIGAGLTGKLMGLYPIEASISGGLCMSNMAQTGDLATLASAKRMDLLPYSSYSSRIGGSVVLIIAGLITAFFGV